MKIISWMSGEDRPCRLTAGELNIIFSIQSHPFFSKIINIEEGEYFLLKIKDLVWNLDELFADIYLMAYNENFQMFCKEKSEQEGLSYVDVMKREVDEYEVTSDTINDNHIVENVVNFLYPRLKKILDEAQELDRASLKGVFREGAYRIYKEALRQKEEEAHRVCGLFDERFTDQMVFRENLTLEEFNRSGLRPDRGIVIDKGKEFFDE